MQGREWERFAWLKSRVVAPRASVDERPRAARCARWSPPFVYRRYLDYGVFEGAAPAAPQGPRRGAAPRRRPARARQRRQAVARRHPRDRVHRAAAAGGARRPVPRDPHPLDAEGAAAAGRRRPDEAGHRRAAGRGLHVPAPRRAPHPVPRRPADARAADRRRRPRLDRRAAWASTGDADACELLDRLGADARVRRHRVRRAAARRPGAGGRRPAAAAAPAAPAPLPVDSEAFLEQLPAELASACAPLVRPAAGAGAARREQAAPGAPGAARGRMRGSDGRCTMEAALRFVDWLEPLLRRESYLALLVERPEVQNRLLRLLGLARWPMRYLMRHPGVIDELADERLLHGRFERGELHRASSRSATPAGSAPARPTRRRCSTRCAAPTTPRCSARWCATSRATSRSSRWPTTCRRWPTRRSRARCAGPGST